MDSNKIKDFITNNKKTIIVLAIIGIVAYGVLSGKSSKKTETPPSSGKQMITTEDKLKAEIESLRKELSELKKGEGQPQKGPAQKEKGTEIEKLPPIETEKKKSLDELKEVLKGGPVPKGDKSKQPVTEQPIQMTPQIQKPEAPRLIKIDIEPSTAPAPVQTKKTSMYLPPGSFASFTTLSGIYAPESGEQMPVVGVIDKAFVGPNKSSIPLKGCLFLGKAKGNTGESRADIKIVEISCVFPDGDAFKGEVGGYATDLSGKFGLTGTVNRHASSFFSTVGITSFIEGFSYGMSRAQEQQSAVSSETSTAVATNIAGDAVKYGMFKGINLFAQAAKQFFGSQLNTLVPSVDVPPGSRGYIFLTTGVKITGGQSNEAVRNSTNYYDTNNLSSIK